MTVLRWMDRARRAITPPPVDLYESTAIAFFVSSSIMSAAELGIPEALRDGPRTCAELASALGAHERSLFRLMRVLVSFGFFELRAGSYALNAVSRQLLPDVPGSMKPLVRWAYADSCIPIYYRLVESVRRGRPAAELAYGMPFFEHLARNPIESERFDDCMMSVSASTSAAVLAVYDLSGARLVVDVGGGLGQFLTFAVMRYPQLRGTLFELPQTAARAASRLRQLGYDDRIDFVEGSFLEDPLPPGADVYVLMNVLHDHGDEAAVRILKNAARVLRPGGRLVVVEVVLTEGRWGDRGTVSDLQMLMLFDGGQERTEAEFRALFAAAGLRISRVLPTAVPSSILEVVAI